MDNYLWFTLKDLVVYMENLLLIHITQYTYMNIGGCLYGQLFMIYA